MIPSFKLIKAAKAVITARAYCETIRPQIENMQSAELAANSYHYCKKWADRLELTMDTDRITNPRHIYRSTDEESAAFYNRMDKRHHAAGYKTEAGQCPLAVAELLVMDITRAFCDMTTELQTVVNPSTFGYYGKYYNEYVEANMRFVCGYIAEKWPQPATIN